MQESTNRGLTFRLPLFLAGFLALALVICLAVYAGTRYRPISEPTGEDSPDAASVAVARSPKPLGRPSGNTRRDPIYDVSRFVALLNKSPAEALVELEKLPPGSDAERTYRSLFTIWGGSTGASSKAAEAALGLPIGPQRSAALNGLIAGWSSLDPKEALDWASTLPEGDSSIFENAILRVGLERGQPALAMEYVGKLENLSERNEAIRSLSPTLARMDPAAALAWLNRVATGETYDQAVASIFASLGRPERVAFVTSEGKPGISFSSAKQDIPTAMTMLEKVTDPVTRQKAIAALASNWALGNPQDALAWAQSLPEADAAARNNALRAIVGTWAKTDPAAALAYVQNSGGTPAYLDVAPALAQSLAKFDPAAAFTFASGMPDGRQKNQAVNNVLMQMSQRDFFGAWAQAAQLPEGAGRDLAMTSLVGVQAKRDAAKAAALLSQLPSPQAQLEATRTLGAAWAQQDAQAYSEWITALPAGGQRDAAAVQLIAAEIKNNPADVFAWANGIGDPELRAAQLQNVLGAWAIQNFSAAIEAAQSANLPDPQRVRLLQSLQSRTAGN